MDHAVEVALVAFTGSLIVATIKALIAARRERRSGNAEESGSP
jgi:hypothetical protein